LYGSLSVDVNISTTNYSKSAINAFYLFKKENLLYNFPRVILNGFIQTRLL